MTDFTTIQVRRDQAERLKEIQGPSGNYKTALDKVLDAHSDSGDDHAQGGTPNAEQLEAVLGRIDDLENTLPKKVEEQLR